jgi:hypothetical protein
MTKNCLIASIASATAREKSAQAKPQDKNAPRTSRANTSFLKSHPKHTVWEIPLQSTCRCHLGLCNPASDHSRFPVGIPSKICIPNSSLSSCVQIIINSTKQRSRPLECADALFDAPRKQAFTPCKLTCSPLTYHSLSPAYCERGS